MSYYQKYETNKNITNSIIKLKDGDIWIKNQFEDKILYINADKINIKEMLLTEVMIIDNSINNKKIFTAEKGLIKKKYLELYNINEIDINKNNNKEYKTKNIKINFNQQDILNSVKYYKYIPFYNYYNYNGEKS